MKVLSKGEVQLVGNFSDQGLKAISKQEGIDQIKGDMLILKIGFINKDIINCICNFIEMSN